MEGTVKAVCTSSVKGVRKEPVKEACLIEDYGIEKDAHAGKWHRQVSLLSWEKVQEFNKSGAGVSRGRSPRADADWQGLPSFLRDQKACRGLHHADGRRVCEGCPGRDGEAGRPCPGASA